MNKMLIPVILTVLAIPIIWIINPLLSIIYLFFWIDKFIITPIPFSRRLGIELITISIVPLGIYYGPGFAFLFTISVSTLFRIIFYNAFHIFEPRWPIFIPHPLHVADAFLAIIASMFANMPFIHVMAIVLFIKFFVYGAVLKFVFGRKFGMISGVINIVFNLILALLISGIFIPA